MDKNNAIREYKNKGSQLISIIVPVYNVDKYINRCLESLCKQSYKNIEIIIVNEGSTDNSRSICEVYKENDSRITILDKENGGLSEARNLGIRNAKGKYITFVDSDDYVSLDYIEYLYDLICLHNADISICESIKFGEVELEEKSLKYRQKIEVFNGNTALENLLYQKSIPHTAWGKMYKSSLFDDNYFPVSKWYEDYGIMYKLFYESSCIVYGKKANYFYYQRSGSITNTNFSKKNMDRAYLTDEMLAYIEEKCPELLEAARNRAYITYLILLRDCPATLEFFHENRMIRDKIKLYRKSVLFNKKSKLSTRFIAGISYISLMAVKKLGGFQKKLKEM